MQQHRGQRMLFTLRRMNARPPHAGSFSNVLSEKPLSPDSLQDIIDELCEESLD